MKEDVQKTQKIGMNKHLSKPIDVHELYKTLLQFLSKKTDDIDIQSTNKDLKQDKQLPEFDHINKEYGLKLVMGNTELFIKILKGLLEYKNLKLEDKNDDEFARLTHTIKGISASAGALKLHKITKTLDETKDKSLLVEFYKELNLVLNEIEQKLADDKNIEFLELSSSKKDELFNTLKQAVATKRAKNCKTIIQELDKYQLKKEDEQLYSKVKALVKKFKFKNALELL
jgi:polar amino acid transport system substrate-binding protein